MGVGRKRKTNKHLPERVYQRRGSYYFVDRKGKWHRLAKTYHQALVALSVLLAADAPTNRMERVIAKYEAEELPKKSAATQKGRRQEFKTLRKVFGHMAPADIQPSDVWNFYRERGETEQGKHEVRGLSAVLTFARKIGALNGPNPCFGLRLPGSGPRNRYVTDEEFLFVRGMANDMIGIAMDLALLCGYRKNDIINLKRSDLLAGGILIETKKDGKEIVMEWSDELRVTIGAALRIGPQVRQYVICTRQGHKYTPDGFGAIWQRLMDKAMEIGLKERFTLNDLRAKSASDADSDEEATARLGHNDSRITRRVYRRLPRRAKPLRILDATP